MPSTIRRGAPRGLDPGLVGSVNLPIIKFSVDWWNTLHQPASILRVGGPAIDASMLWPLLVMFGAFLCYFVAVHILRTRAELTSARSAICACRPIRPPMPAAGPERGAGALEGEHHARIRQGQPRRPPAAAGRRCRLRLLLARGGGGQLGDIARLPYSLKVLFENLLRHEDGRTVTPEQLQALVGWLDERRSDQEIAFRPARVLMQDFTGVPGGGRSRGDAPGDASSSAAIRRRSTR